MSALKFLKSVVSSKKEKQSDERSWSTRLRERLQRTRQQLSNTIASLLLGKKTLDAELSKELETLLISSDVGVNTTQKILDQLVARTERKALPDADILWETLKEILLDILAPCEQVLDLHASPFVMLMVGANGTGKTTSIAKLAHYYQEAGQTVMLAAGDTFRAAAVEQLQTWGKRNKVTVIAGQSGSDSSSIIFDSIQAAQSKKINLLIADTAGRLHTQKQLMAELKKIKRVIAKKEAGAPHEVMLVIDASMGQNALHQAQSFHEAIGLTGLIITKLDGTARGGIVFAIADALQLPIRFIGIGEQLTDLKPFNAKEYVDALFEKT